MNTFVQAYQTHEDNCEAFVMTFFVWKAYSNKFIPLKISNRTSRERLNIVDKIERTDRFIVDVVVGVVGSQSKRLNFVVRVVGQI